MKRVLIGAVLAVVTVGAAPFGVPAAAAVEPDWDALAACESSGDWSVNTGNGFFGGLQFHPQTWRAYRPPGAPERADLASRAQQIEAGRRVLAVQGPGAWPACSAKTGWHRK